MELFRTVSLAEKDGVNQTAFHTYLLAAHPHLWLAASVPVAKVRRKSKNATSDTPLCKLNLQ
ncbi:hypothetical protein S7335_4232 [Synechococcus sp. PCC 7335]|nr:hypothetical protein S7335_4232 [Synechococcus sp. PCC 7335]